MRYAYIALVAVLGALLVGGIAFSLLRGKSQSAGQ